MVTKIIFFSFSFLYLDDKEGHQMNWNNDEIKQKNVTPFFWGCRIFQNFVHRYGCICYSLITRWQNMRFVRVADCHKCKFEGDGKRKCHFITFCIITEKIALARIFLSFLVWYTKFFPCFCDLVHVFLSFDSR